MVEKAGKRKILIVDDEMDFAESIFEYFHQFTDYSAKCAFNGEDALKIIGEEKIDLLITDIKMPGITGLELLTKVRTMQPDTGVIIMTGYHLPEIQQIAQSRGAIHYIEKPFEMTEIEMIAEEFLDRVKGEEDKGRGFKGNVLNVDLRDIIQLNCLTRKTGSISVAHEEHQGRIYLEDGEVVHCTCDGITGEEAFAELMKYESGVFSMDGSRTSEKTIDKSWYQLLLDSFLFIDEEAYDEKRPDDFERREKAAESDDGDDEKYYALVDDGFNHFRGGNYPSARQSWEMALEIKPDDRTVLFNLKKLAEKEQEANRS